MKHKPSIVLLCSKECVMNFLPFGLLNSMTLHLDNVKLLDVQLALPKSYAILLHFVRFVTSLLAMRHHSSDIDIFADHKMFIYRLYNYTLCRAVCKITSGKHQPPLKGILGVKKKIFIDNI